MSLTSPSPARTIAAALIGSTFALTAWFGASTASAITTPPRLPVDYPCVHLVGTPDPCPSTPPTPPVHTPPPPVDPGCLRVDVEPLHCPYQP